MTSYELKVLGTDIWNHFFRYGQLTAGDLRTISEHPEVLTSPTLWSDDALLVMLAGIVINAPALKQLKPILTPEILTKPIICGGSPTTAVEMITKQRAVHHLDPVVYRKALAIALRKDESIYQEFTTSHAGWLSHEDESVNRERAVTALRSAIIRGEPFSTELDDYVVKHPIILVTRPIMGGSRPLSAALWYNVDGGRPAYCLKHWSDLGVITPEMLLVKVVESTVGGSTILDKINATGLAGSLDQNVYRRAMAMHLKQESTVIKSGADAEDEDQSNPALDAARRKNLLITIACKTSGDRGLNAQEIAAIKADPSILLEPSIWSDLSLIGRAVLYHDYGSRVLKTLSDAGIITPEMLLTQFELGTGLDTRVIDKVNQYPKCAKSLNPAVYRKAMAMRLKQESMRSDWKASDEERTHNQFEQVLKQAENDISAKGKISDSVLRYVRARPHLATTKFGRLGYNADMIEKAISKLPQSAKAVAQLAPFITVDRLVSSNNFGLGDLISKIMAKKHEHFFDQKLIRQAVAAKHRQEESAARSVISKMIC